MRNQLQGPVSGWAAAVIGVVLLLIVVGLGLASSPGAVAGGALEGIAFLFALLLLPALALVIVWSAVRNRERGEDPDEDRTHMDE